jgi:hypothetical protein
MSAYGKLWEEVAGIRKALQGTVPRCKFDSLENAKKSLLYIQTCIQQWEQLEKEMALCKDE